jgi:polar amino acid transport system substrate-binding protein
MFRFLYLSAVLVLASLTLGTQSLPVSAQSISCDTTYVVERGDNLSSIAQRAYGNQGLAQYLYDVNWQVVGDDPSQLQPGDRLSVPCLGGGGNGGGTGGGGNGGGTGGGQTVDVGRPGSVIAFLTAEDFAPFTDKAYPEGGMLAKVVKEITQDPFDGRESKIYWVNDWSAHLQSLLLERDAFDAAFPWYQPDCTQRETLDENGRFRCDSFLFSDPLYRIVVPFYTRADNPLDPRTAQDLEGQRVCRPRGYFTFDLAQKGLIDPGGNPENNLITLVKADTPTDCFRQLMDGRVDFVTINAATAASPIRELGIDGEIVERDGLSSIETLHVIIPKERPEARVLLFEINRRLRALRDSGEHTEIARRYLEIYYGGGS